MNKKQNKNKRAFTLTELLIVVIVIGVLSAVTLPKFNRVIENRKVTEAEEMMSAVRTEQERRCAMDKNYTLKFDNLADVISSSDTKNYKYSLQTEGISATSNKGKYTLKMLSYQDGSFCCTGDDCAKLNKNYPNCDGLTFPSSGCGSTDGTAELTPDPTPTPEPTPEPSCEGSQPADQVKACACGTVKASYSCSAATNYKWVLGAFPDCPAKPADETETCPNGTVRTKSYTCVNGAWAAGNWDKECTSNCPAGRVEEPFSGDCICEAEWNETEEYTKCSGTAQEWCPVGDKGKLVLRDVIHFWNSDTCKCEYDCARVPTFWRCQRGDADAAYFEKQYESEEAAKRDCLEQGNLDASYAILRGGAVDKNGFIGTNWSEIWYCTDQNIPCGGGMGRCDPCTCSCGVG